jgi:hypothetical protein
MGKMRHSQHGRIAVAAAVAVAVLLGATATFICSVWAQDQPDLGLLLEELSQDGLKYRKLDDTTWIVPFEGDDDLTVNVFVTYNNDKKSFALLFATVVDKDDKFDYNLDVLLECMKLNNDYPGVKFCLDYDNGDLDCQSEVLMKTITAESLETHINLVAALANTSHTKLNNLVP